MRLFGVIASWLAWWAVLLGLYMLFAAKLSWEEAIVGAGIAGLGATGAFVTLKAGEVHFRPRLRWLTILGRLPGNVLADCGIVGAALWQKLVQRRPVEGVFRTVPFDAGGDDPESAARRALVTAGVSLSPNTYVLGIDRQRGLLLVHQLVPSGKPPGKGDKEWPI